MFIASSDRTLPEASESASAHEIDAAWQRADPIPGLDPDRYRRTRDRFRATIRRDRFEARRRAYAWTLDAGEPVYAGHRSLLTALDESLEPLRRRRGG